MNDQPPRPMPDPTADPTAAPAGADPTAAPAPSSAQESTVVAPPDAPEWLGESGPAWAAAQPLGAQPDASYEPPPGPAYGAAPAGGYPGAWVPPVNASGSGGTSGFAVASLIFGVLGGILFSVIFGIVALVRIRKTGQSGRGLAIAGLTLAGCWVLVIVVAVTAATVRDSGNDSSGTVAVTEAKPGDCVENLESFASITDLPIVSCADPHEGEVYAVFDLPDGPWPGETAIEQQVDERCQAELKTYAPTSADTVEMYTLRPQQRFWSRDHGVTCVATDERGATTGSVRD